MRPKVPWTKTMLEKFVDEALLTEDEEKVLRTRIAGWSIVKQSMEMGLSTASVSRLIQSIRKKYKAIQPKFPDIFPPLKQTKYEKALDAFSVFEDIHCIQLLEQFETKCGKDTRNMGINEIIECQKNCPYNNFYK